MSRRSIPFTDYPLDRADELRGDDDRVASWWSGAHPVRWTFWRGRPLVEHGPDGQVTPVVLPVDELPGPIAVRLFCGLDDDRVPVLAASLDPTAEPEPAARGAFEEVRPLAGRMSVPDLAVAGTARSMFAWHRRDRFCSGCGAATEVITAGWRRRCPGCEREHFPRMDPVVIALITHGDRTMLGRGPRWPARLFSCIAGFVEPGETLGDATRREAFEETSLEIGDVTYLFSQPWPYPSSLMLGVAAEATSDHLEVDGVELAEARWFTRDEVVQMLDGIHPEVDVPLSIAVAHHLLRWWISDGR